MLLVIGTFAVAACGDTSPAETRELRNLVYCENPEVASPSCDLTGYSLADDSELRTKLETCAVGGCHGTGGTAVSKWTLDLSEPTVTVQSALVPLATYTGLNGDYLVDEFDPDCSYMLTKLTDRPAGGSRMPYGLPHWSASEIDCFRSYLHEMSN